ncbi:FUSC family protein, partial [Patulibacter sp. NPDC049589]|uniref:FUSC family protein n=1 Tax=Patulibacter sp. NPDC049589 TaxID=3154731 RepID=UPI00342BEAEC
TAAGHDAIVAVRRALDATDRAAGPAWSRRVLAAELVLEAALTLEVEAAPPLDPAWTVRLLAQDGAVTSPPPPLPDHPAGPLLAQALASTAAAWASPSADDAGDDDAPAHADPRWRPPLSWSVRRGSPHLRTAWRLGGAVLGGLLVGHVLGLDHPSWVAVTAAAILQGSSLSVARRRAVHRVVGTLAGVIVAGAVLALDPSDGVQVALIAAFLLVFELALLASYALAVTAITPLILLLISLSGAGRAVGGLLDNRLLDTVVGVVVATVVLLASRPRGGRGPLPVAQAEAVRAVAAVLLDAVRPGTARHDLLAGRRRVHDAILLLRDAEDEAIGDILRRDPRDDARWPITATIERLARLSLTIPADADRPPLGTDGEARLRAGLDALARRVAGERDVTDPGPFPELPGLPYASATITRLREQLLDGTPVAPVAGSPFGDPG